MTTSNSELRELLDDLIQICKDGQEGFVQAAAGVEDSDLNQLFLSVSQQRAQYAGELQETAHSLGEAVPETESSVAGALHRSWMDLKSAISGKDRHAILAECERGEDVAVQQYGTALKGNLPANLRGIIQRQFIGVKASHDRVRALRDASEK